MIVVLYHLRNLRKSVDEALVRFKSVISRTHPQMTQITQRDSAKLR